VVFMISQSCIRISHGLSFNYFGQLRIVVSFARSFYVFLYKFAARNKKASAPTKGRRLKAPRYHPLHPDRIPFTPIPSKEAVRKQNGLRPRCTRYVGRASSTTRETPVFSPGKKSRNPTRPGVKAAFPFHRGGSEASSPIPPAGSHQPPALWKGYAGYYSSSQPLIIVSNNKKILDFCQVFF
jgi:hypothetical protein